MSGEVVPDDSAGTHGSELRQNLGKSEAATTSTTAPGMLVNVPLDGYQRLLLRESPESGVIVLLMILASFVSLALAGRTWIVFPLWAGLASVVLLACYLFGRLCGANERARLKALTSSAKKTPLAVIVNNAIEGPRCVSLNDTLRLQVGLLADSCHRGTTLHIMPLGEPKPSSFFSLCSNPRRMQRLQVMDAALTAELVREKHSPASRPGPRLRGGGLDAASPLAGRKSPREVCLMLAMSLLAFLFWAPYLGALILFRCDWLVGSGLLVRRITHRVFPVHLGQQRTIFDRQCSVLCTCGENANWHRVVVSDGRKTGSLRIAPADSDLHVRTWLTAQSPGTNNAGLVS